MWKLLYKTILVSVLSGCLMLMDFSYKGQTLRVEFAQSVQAETVKTDGVSDNNLMSTLTMTAIGLITSRLFTYKPTVDVIVAAAGGAAYVAGEILATIGLRKVMKDMETEITRDKYGNINKEQIESLEKLKKSYVQAKKTAETKKMLQMAAAAAFAAAGVLAVTLKSSEMLAVTGCTAALTASIPMCPMGPGVIAPVTAASALASLTSQVALREAPAPSLPQQTQEAGFHTLFAAQLAASTAAYTASAAAWAAVPEPTGATKALAAACASAATKIAVCTAVPTTFLTTTSAGVPAVAGVNINHLMPKPQLYAANTEKSLLGKFFNFIISDSHASLFSPLGIASSAAIAFLLMLYPVLGVKIDILLFTPMKRGIIWGVLAVMTFAASTATSNVIAKIEENIKKIDNILKNMYTMTNGVAATQIIQQTSQSQVTIKSNAGLNANAVNYEDVDLSNSPQGSLPCFTGPDPKNCKSLEESAKNLPSTNALDQASQQQLAGILKATNGLNGTSKISNATLAANSQLAGNASAIRSNLDKIKKSLQDELKKSGSKTNLSDEAGKFSDDIDKAVRAALKKSNSSAADMVASLYSGSGAVGGSASTAVAATKEEAVKKSGEVGAVVDISAANLAPMSANLGGAINKSDTSTATEVATNDVLKGSVNIDDYDLKNDITKDTSSSIFEVISNRYQKSAYQRLFKLREKEAAVKN